MGVTHVSLSMKPNRDLWVYKNRGRPTGEEVGKLKCPKKMRKELKRTKKEMNFEMRQRFFIASDEMARSMHMFPEVFYMDVTAKTNEQKRELFLMVVKDATGEPFIINATSSLPTRDEYSFRFTISLLQLYEENTIGCNRWALTDDDNCEYVPLDNCIATMS